MKHVALLAGLALLLVSMSAGCESGQPTGETKQTAETAQTGSETMAEGAGGADAALKAPSVSPGRMENDEGVGHYEAGHWDVAEVHFRKALEADPGLAVAHFNLALALDKLGNHGEATKHFQQAADLAPENANIVESQILQQHVGM